MSNLLLLSFGMRTTFALCHWFGKIPWVHMILYIWRMVLIPNNGKIFINEYGILSGPGFYFSTFVVPQVVLRYLWVCWSVHYFGSKMMWVYLERSFWGLWSQNWSFCHYCFYENNVRKLQRRISGMVLNLLPLMEFILFHMIFEEILYFYVEVKFSR